MVRSSCCVTALIFTTCGVFCAPEYAAPDVTHAGSAGRSINRSPFLSATSASAARVAEPPAFWNSSRVVPAAIDDP